jgi:four helix bundle protein
VRFGNQNLLDRVKLLSITIIKMTNHFPKNEPAAWKISEQITDAAMSVYANLREAQVARSGKEFVSIHGIALREATETEGWLEIIDELTWIKKKIYIRALLRETREICKIISSIILKSKGRR